jgi:hypothetical protein
MGLSRPRNALASRWRSLGGVLAQSRTTGEARNAKRQKMEQHGTPREAKQRKKGTTQGDSDQWRRHKALKWSQRDQTERENHSFVIKEKRENLFSSQRKVFPFPLACLFHLSYVFSLGEMKVSVHGTDLGVFVTSHGATSSPFASSRLPWVPLWPPFPPKEAESEATRDAKGGKRDAKGRQGGGETPKAMKNDQKGAVGKASSAKKEPNDGHKDPWERHKAPKWSQG